MVSGVTITRGSRHPAQTLASATQKKPISRAQLRRGHRSLVDGELLVQGEVFEGELAVATAKKGQKAKQLEQEGDHRTRIFSGSEPADQPLPAGLNFGEGQVTMARGCLHPAQTLASPTQKNRSAVRSLGRVIVLLYTASCWCKARFSRASWRWPPQRIGKR